MSRRPSSRKLLNPLPREELVKLLGQPLTFKEFLSSISGEVELSKVQEEDLMISLGEGALFGDPFKFFDKSSRPLLNVFLWGKGSGKGTVTSLAILYMIHLMHYLLPNPPSYFGLSYHDPLSVIIVSTNEDQAIEFLNGRIRPRIESCPFFNQFPIIVASLNKTEPINSGLYRPELSAYPIKIGAKEIDFKFINTTLISVPSRNESFEGKTVIGFIMDEASGHISTRGKPNAEKIFNTLTTSTRNLPYLGYITSYPRETRAKDFTYKKYIEILIEKKIPNAFASRRASWEANPRLYEEAGGKFFRIEVKEFNEVFDVPDTPELRKAFERDFHTAVSRYIALPLGEAKPTWITILENVDADFFVDRNRPPAVDFEAGPAMMSNGRIGYKINIKKVDNSAANLVPYFLGVDAGETDCQAAITLAHAIVQRGFPILVIDAILVWKPEKEKGILVDFQNFYAVLARLIKDFNIKYARSDRWQTSLASTLVENWDRREAGYNEYNMLKTLISNNPPLIRFPYQVESYEALAQLKDLHTPTSDKVKPKVSPGNYQDIADSIACAVGIFSELFKVDPETLEVKYDVPAKDEQPVQDEIPVAFIERSPMDHPAFPLQSLVPPSMGGYGPTPRILTTVPRNVPRVPNWIRFRNF